MNKPLNSTMNGCYAFFSMELLALIKYNTFTMIPLELAVKSAYLHKTNCNTPQQKNATSIGHFSPGILFLLTH